MQSNWFTRLVDQLFQTVRSTDTNGASSPRRMQRNTSDGGTSTIGTKARSCGMKASASSAEVIAISRPVAARSKNSAIVRDGEP
jgi:hypothetical protein